jgi:hypothetical protein
MAKYRKKPVVIDAVQFKDDDFAPVLKLFPESKEWKGWLHEDKKWRLDVPTLEGVTVASDGDYVIKGIKGEFYACKPDIFEQTYEKVE